MRKEIAATGIACIVFILFLLTSSCSRHNKTVYRKSCLDSCSTLYAEITEKFKNGDYHGVIRLPDGYECCDSTAIVTFLECKALSFFELKNYPETIALLTKLIKINKRDDRYYSTRGNAYEQMHMITEALADYNNALALNPYRFEERNYRGRIYQLLGKTDSAMADFDFIIAHDSSFAAAFNNRGLLFTLQGKYHEAMRDYKQALSGARPDVALFNMSAAAVHLGEVDSALSYINEAIEMGAKTPVVYYDRRAYVYLMLGNKRAAYDDIAKIQRSGGVVADSVLNFHKNK